MTDDTRDLDTGCPGCGHELTGAGECTFDGCSSSITFEAVERSVVRWQE